MKRNIFTLSRISAALLLCGPITHSLAFEVPSFEYDDAYDSSEPTVITPVRMKQALRDSPSTVTVITEDMIEGYGATSVVEALRLVPGIQIAYTGSQVAVSYHGTNGLQARRLKVLVDGNALWRPAFSLIAWKSLPVALQDVERIEFNRGSGSSTYDNAFMAVINIITKHPARAENKLVISANQQSSAQQYASVRYNAPKFGFRVSVDHEKDKGFDETINDSPYNDDVENNRLNFKLLSKQSDNHFLEVVGSYITGERESHFIDGGQQETPVKEFEDHFISGEWNSVLDKHWLKVKLTHFQSDIEEKWDTCYPAVFWLPETQRLFSLNSGYVETLIAGGFPTGGSAEDDAALGSLLGVMGALGADAMAPVCGNVNQDYYEERRSIEFLDTFQVTDDLRVIGVLSYTEEIGKSETYLYENTEKLDTTGVSFNMEYQMLVDTLVLNAGAYYEKNSYEDGLFAPRASVNYHFDKENTVKFSVSKSFRTPDIFEQNARWVYTATNISSNIAGAEPLQFYATAQSLGELEPEEIKSYELSYLGHYIDSGATLQVKIFKDELSNLISQELQLFDFNPDNSGEVELTGAEADLSYEISTNWRLNAGVAYLDNETDSAVEKSLYSRWSGFFATSYSLTDEYKIGGAYYGASNETNTQSYNRYDLLFTYKPSQFDYKVKLDMLLQYTPNPVFDVVSNPNFVETSNADAQNTVQRNDDRYIATATATFLF